MLGEILSEGFALAHRNPALILLDLFWKGVWLTLTLSAFVGIAWWFGGSLAAMPLPDAVASGAGVWRAAILVRQFWDEYAGQLTITVVAALLLSAAAWLLLEAFFRSLALSPRQKAGVSSARPVRAGMAVFLVSRVAKLAIFIGANAVVGIIIFLPYLKVPLTEWSVLWIDSRSSVVVALIGLTVFAFLLSVIETLIRSDALDLWGTHLIHVTGLIGTLLLFETLIVLSLAIIILFGLLNASRVIELALMLGVAVVASILVTCLHSYLLLVRFCAVERMKCISGSPESAS